jgi:hypothetical protein
MQFRQNKVETFCSFLSYLQLEMLLYLGFGLCWALFWLHRRSQGETSLPAFAAFMVAGLLLGLPFGIPHLVKAETRIRNVQSTYDGKSVYRSMETELAGCAVCIGVAGLVAATLTASVIYSERRRYYHQD